MSTTDIRFEDGRFHLSNDKVSYIMELARDRWLLHRYWGRALPGYGGSNCPAPARRSFAATPAEDDPLFSMDMAPQEFSAPHQGDFRESSVSVRRCDGWPAGRFRYDGYAVADGLPEPEGMPHIRPRADQAAKTLSVRFLEEQTGVALTLRYSILEGSAAIVRSMRVENRGEEPVWLERALSAMVDMPFEGEDVVTFHGSHEKEFQLDRRRIGHGVTAVGTTRGASGPQHPSFAAVCAPEATEFSGEVRAFQLIYSGNHCARVERDQYDSVRVAVGISPDGFEWKLDAGAAFETPEAVLVYSGEGFNGMSQEFHQLYTDRLMPPRWARKTRPLLLNSWEMCYFDISEQKILDVIQAAADLGFELVVMDDGWFGHRDDDTSSLGDWQVHREKFPNGLTPLLDRARECGVQFGIWFEPEMISPDSELMRAHPDWASRFPGVEPLTSRHQLVLDLTRPEVQDYLLETLTSFLETYPVSYIKWDMNRHMTDPGSQALPWDQTGEFCHRYMLGLYRVLGEITSRFPDVLFENCSSGGGRFDPGMTFYMPQTWCSDNSDALDRESIQYGASYTFPASAITAHVSASPNHQTGRHIPFQTRADVASSANMGYEMGILDLDPATRDAVRRHLETFKAERDLVFDGDFFRLRSPFDGNVCAWMLTDHARDKAIVYAFAEAYSSACLYTLLKMPCLDPARTYMEEGTGRRFSGAELGNAGLAVRFEKGDYPCLKRVLTAERRA